MIVLKEILEIKCQENVIRREKRKTHTSPGMVCDSVMKYSNIVRVREEAGQS